MLADATSTNAAVSGVTGAIAQAARATGTSFQYLLATAQIESNLNPTVKSARSSATGLFQFLDQTWLATMKEHGAALGYGAYADVIGKTASGKYFVRDPALRDRIMGLRRDAAANAAMAGAFTRANGERLAQRIGRPATDGELYIAHFLGAGGAAKLINAAEHPSTGIFGRSRHSAADLFPRAAAANRAIFYDRSGRARSPAEVYGVLAGKFNAVEARLADVSLKVAAADKAQQTAPAPPKIASAQPRKAWFPMTAAPPAAASAPRALYPVDRLAVAVGASSSPLFGLTHLAQTYAPDGSPRPVLYDLFRTDDRGAVSSAVTQLWGANALAAAVPAPGADSGRTGGAPLDLNRFTRPAPGFVSKRG